MGASFNALWLGQSISLLGDYIAYYTVPKFVLELTDRATDFTVDRMNRRRLALYSDLLRAGAFGGLAYLAQVDRLEIWMVVVIAFVVGSLAASFNSALMSFVPSVVGRQRLATANARLAISQQLAFAAGPLVGVVLLELTDSFSITFALNGATFIVSAISLLVARPMIRQARVRASGFGAEFRAGLSFLWNDTLLRYTVMGGFAANFVVGFVEPTLVLVSSELLGFERALEFGWVFGALGIGGLLGAVTAPTVIRRIHLGRTFAAGFFLFGFGLFGLASQGPLPATLGGILVGFIGLPWINVAMVTIRQHQSPDEMLGRITASSRAIAWGSLPIGAVVGGYLADNVLGLRTTLFIGPVAMLAIGVLLLFSPVWRTRTD